MSLNTSGVSSVLLGFRRELSSVLLGFRRHSRWFPSSYIREGLRRRSRRFTPYIRFTSSFEKVSVLHLRSFSVVHLGRGFRRAFGRRLSVVHFVANAKINKLK